MSSEGDRFQEIADQLLRDDPRFYQRATRISGFKGPARVQIRRIGAILAMAIGFPLMMATIVIDLPLLGLLVFIIMLSAIMPAARDLSSLFKLSWLDRSNGSSGRHDK